MGIIIIFLIVITMGQSTHGMQEGQIFEPDELQSQEFAHLARSHLFLDASDSEQATSPAQQIPSCSPLMKKLQQYDKNKLIKVIKQQGPMQKSRRKEQKATQQYQDDHDHPRKSTGKDKQLRESKRLQRLKEQCSRISKLREEYLEKSMTRTTVDLANHVHLHESIFQETQLKEKSPKATLKGKP